jgi:hypothetical protein
MRFSRTAVVAAAVTATVLSAGVAYAATAGTPVASKTDTIVTTTANRHLSATGGVPTTIIQMNLPPGAYVLHASGDLVNFSPSDFTRCQITVAGTQQVAAVSTLVGNPGLAGARGPAGLLSPFALVGGANNATGTTEMAVLQCSHDTAGPTPYVDSSASLWAHKTSGLKLATQ